MLSPYEIKPPNHQRKYKFNWITIKNLQGKNGP
jgi:hypothetical protein